MKITLIFNMNKIYVELYPQNFNKLQGKNGRLPKHWAAMQTD